MQGPSRTSGSLISSAASTQLLADKESVLCCPISLDTAVFFFAAQGSSIAPSGSLISSAASSQLQEADVWNVIPPPRKPARQEVSTVVS